MSKILNISLDKGDSLKLEILKKRFMFDNDVDVIRYLLTEAVEVATNEFIQLEKLKEREKQRQKKLLEIEEEPVKVKATTSRTGTATGAVQQQNVIPAYS